MVSRRRVRVCTREACEACREKKAKCDGEQPCSRCEARSLDCMFQIRKYRSKRSLRNELNVLKERHKLQKTLIAALQEPQRREAALQLLETDDSLAGAANIWLKEDIDPDAHRRPEAFSSHFNDDGHRSTLGSTSPSVESATSQHTLGTPSSSPQVWPCPNNSFISDIHGADDYSMPPGSFTMGTCGPLQQHPQDFMPSEGAPVIEGLPYLDQLIGFPSVFRLTSQQPMSWIDLSLTENNNIPLTWHQQHSNPFQLMAGGTTLAWNGNNVATGTLRDFMTPQEQPPLIGSFDAIDFGHCNSPLASI